MNNKESIQDFVNFHAENKLCTAVENDGSTCWNIIYAKRYCRKHYKRFKRRGDINLPIKAIKKCKMITCDNNCICKGYCKKHYEKHIVAPKNKNKNCKVENCNKKRTSHSGYCSMHKTRLIRYGTLLGSGVKHGKHPNIKLNLRKGSASSHRKHYKCIAPDCNKDYKNSILIKGLCSKHYQRWKKYRDYNLVLPKSKKKESKE